MEFFSFWLICSTAFVWFLIPVPLQVAGDIETLVLFLLIPLVNWYDHKKRNPVLSRTFEVPSQPILQLHQQSWEWSMDLTKAPPSSTHSPPSSSGPRQTAFSLCSWWREMLVPVCGWGPSITCPKHLDSVFSHWPQCPTVRQACQENSLKQGRRFSVALPDSGLTLTVGPGPTERPADTPVTSSRWCMAKTHHNIVK